MKAFEFTYQDCIFRVAECNDGNDLKADLAIYDERHEGSVFCYLVGDSKGTAIRALMAALAEARAENARLTEQLRLRDELGYAMKAVQEENARLREALEKLDDFTIHKGYCDRGGENKCNCGLREARAALAPKETNDATK